MLIAFAAAMLMVALAVKFDSKGFGALEQHPYGFNNELIEFFKFRSMYIEQT